MPKKLPRRCPYEECRHLRRTRTKFYRMAGSYRRSDDKLVQRYQCRSCRKFFSDQTLVESFRLKKPELDPLIFDLLKRGYSIRATARMLGIDRKTVQRRLRRKPVPGGRVSEAARLREWLRKRRNKKKRPLRPRRRR
ncbi:MAG: helix-turn-helix domain-containing protein [Acidobacteriota bacterium]